MVIGWEALIVLQDLRGLTPGEQADVSTWAAHALIQAALQDPHETRGARSSPGHLDRGAGNPE
jgi:hypothetical protein